MVEIPKTDQIEGMMRIYVQTGPSMGDVFCYSYLKVYVRIISKGNLGDKLYIVWTKILALEEFGSPRDIKCARTRLTRLYYNKPMTIWVLDLSHMMASKLRAFANRGIDKDFHDIVYLLDNNHHEIRSIRHDLNSVDIMHFCSSQFFTNLDEQNRAKYRNLLVL